jgi:uncharacterized protein with ATP-grasp and redox domains
LLELNEQILKKNGFKDVWQVQKQVENTQALSILALRLTQIDSIQDPNTKWLEVFRGVLAGNIFDAGATAVQDLLKNNSNFGLDEALQKIPSRPWLIDSFDEFLTRTKNVRNLKS